PAEPSGSPSAVSLRSTPLPPERTSGAFDDDILGRGNGEMQPRVDPYFKQIFDQFVSVKRRCNEPTAGLVYERFAEKLVKNREDLMLRTGCRDVRFTVYVKDGKAALKATPVKDEV
ncbi:MAG TPA: MXAN_5187 C-terminal domain-containing protein, partial [Kofleriaceae bacterium]